MLTYIFCVKVLQLSSLYRTMEFKERASNFPGGNKRIGYICLTFFMALSKYAKVISKSIYRS